MSSKYFRNFSRHIRFNSRDRNTSLLHRFTFKSITNVCEISYANEKHIDDDSQRIRQNNAQIEHEFRSILNASKNLKHIQTRMSKIAIIHESTIFDERYARLMNELNTTRFRALKISSSTKKENKDSSRRSLKTEMKDLLRHHVRVDFDSDREHRQKAFTTARSIKKNRKFIVDLNTNREN